MAFPALGVTVALALFAFPSIGHSLGLSETQFGLWSALAIHDPSSVVGATLQYGAGALQIGTTVKLARALWIVPVTFAIGFTSLAARESGAAGKPKRPWFILGFLIAAALAAIRPRAAIVIAFIVGAPIPIAEALRSGGFPPGILALGFGVAGALVGAYLGIAVRRSASSTSA